MKFSIDRIFNVIINGDLIQKRRVAEAITRLYSEHGDGKISKIPSAQEIIEAPERYYVLYDRDATDLNTAIIGACAIRMRTGEIMRLVIRRDMRRRGLGKLLLLFIISEATRNGLREVHLWVHKDNEPMIKLVEKIGFKRDGENKNSYKYVLQL